MFLECIAFSMGSIEWGTKVLCRRKSQRNLAVGKPRLKRRKGEGKTSLWLGSLAVYFVARGLQALRAPSSEGMQPAATKAVVCGFYKVAGPMKEQDLGALCSYFLPSLLFVELWSAKVGLVGKRTWLLCRFCCCRVRWSTHKLSSMISSFNATFA